MNTAKKMISFTGIVSVVLFSQLATAAGHGDHSHDSVAALTDKNGMTLYTFDKDKKGESVCYDACAAKWPPYVASDSAKAKKGYEVITRKDGTKQWAYNNQPLYTWVGDTKPGDATGNGVGGVWHTATKQATKKPSYSSNGY